MQSAQVIARCSQVRFKVCPNIEYPLYFVEKISTNCVLAKVIHI